MRNPNPSPLTTVFHRVLHRVRVLYRVRDLYRVHRGRSSSPFPPSLSVRRRPSTVDRRRRPPRPPHRGSTQRTRFNFMGVSVLHYVKPLQIPILDESLLNKTHRGSRSFERGFSSRAAARVHGTRARAPYRTRRRETRRAKRRTSKLRRGGTRSSDGRTANEPAVDSSQRESRA